MDEIEWWEFDSLDELAEQVAGDIGFVIESAIAAHGSARIAVAAGAEPVLAALAAGPADWSKVTVMPTHDRLSGGDGNSARLQSRLGAKGAQVVSLVDGAAADDPKEAGRLANQRLATLHWPLDLALLEVDAEGRAAGFMPGPDLDAAISGPRERRAVGVAAPDGGLVTLTAAALSSARAVMILVRGSEARAALEQAIKDGPLSSQPVGRLLSEIDAAVDIFFSAD